MSNEAAPEIRTDCLSLVVGVTGHRDIASADEPALRKSFSGVLDRLAAACPATPLLLLSGLAAGADSLAAEVALERGVPVIGCLPMPIAEFEQTLGSQEAIERFKRLMDRCARITVVSPTRHKGYVALGHFLAQYSHLLVAFWDGDQGRGEGGTADVIAMRMTGAVQTSDVERIPYLPDIGPVEVIVTPHESAPRPPDAFTCRRIYPKHFARDPDRTFEVNLAHINTYNSDLKKQPARPGDGGLDAIMNRTDAVANRLQKWTNGSQIFFFIAAVAAAVAQVASASTTGYKVALMVLLFVVWLVARKLNYENRYQDYRALAEGLRVQIAWYCAGMRRHLVDNSYLRMQEGELQWIRMALRFFHLIFCEPHEHPEAAHDHPVCVSWIRSQWRYYYGASRKQLACKRLIDRGIRAALALGLLGTAFAVVELASQGLLRCALGLTQFCPSPLPAGVKFNLLKSLLTGPIAVAVVAAAVLGHYAERQNLNANAGRYERMFHVFDRARRQLAAIEKGAPGSAREVLYNLGSAALVEHADWLIMRRDRPIEVVMV